MRKTLRTLRLNKHMEAYVKHNIQEGIATIEFFHPEQNSLPGAILAQLANTITEVGNKKDL